MSLFASTTPIPKLLDNWNIWFRSVKLTMISLNLWKFCVYSEEVVDDIASLNRAMAIIFGSLTEVDANLVLSCESPFSMLDALKMKYEGSRSSSIMSLKGEFYTLEYDDDLNFIGCIREINAKLMSLGNALEESDMCQRVLAILPHDYQDIVGQLRVMAEFNGGKGLDLNLSKVESLLRQRIKDRVTDKSNCLPSSLGAVTLASASSEKKLPECYYCHKTGHIRKNCFEFLNKKKSNDTNVLNTRSTNSNSAVLSILKESDVVVTDRFYADSGSSSHIVNNRNWLVNYRECNELFDTAVGQINVLGYGDLNCECFTGTFWHNVTIRNVAYAKQKYNLISVGQIERTNENCSVVFSGGRMSVIKNGECMLTGYRSSVITNIYFLLIRIGSTIVGSDNVSLVSTSLVDLVLLHESSCHVNKETIVAKSEVVNDLSNIGTDNICCDVEFSDLSCDLEDHGDETNKESEEITVDKSVCLDAVENVLESGTSLGSTDKKYEERLDESHSHNVVDIETTADVLSTFVEASSEETSKWFVSMEDEMESSIENQAFSMVNVTSKWKFCIKSFGWFKVHLYSLKFTRKVDIYMCQFLGAGCAWKLNRSLYRLEPVHRTWNELFHNGLIYFWFHKFIVIKVMSLKLTGFLRINKLMIFFTKVLSSGRLSVFRNQLLFRGSVRIKQ